MALLAYDNATEIDVCDVTTADWTWLLQFKEDLEKYANQDVIGADTHHSLESDMQPFQAMFEASGSEGTSVAQVRARATTPDPHKTFVTAQGKFSAPCWKFWL